jgi:hypothetical protein
VLVSDRVLLTAATLAVLVGLSLLMVRGWRARAGRQRDLPPPPRPPATPGEVVIGLTPGLFVGTTFAGDWLDRVVVHGLAHRASGWVSVSTDGVRFDREGEGQLYLPFDAVDGAEVGDALAGKVIGKGGMLLVDWRLGSRVLTSGFRADDHREHRRLAGAINAARTAPLPVREDT